MWTSVSYRRGVLVMAALVPKAEIDGEMGDAPMGMQARLMSQALRKLTGIISKSKTAMIFINQLRQTIGMFVGNPETTTGGNALKFCASVRLDVRRISQIKDGEETTGSRVRVKVVKNKVAPPFRQAEFDMMYDEGISREGDLLDLASERGLVHRSGAWYSYQEDRIGQGRENVKKYLKEHADVAAAIEPQLRQTLGFMRVAAEPAAGADPNVGSWGLGPDDVSADRWDGKRQPYSPSVKHARQNGRTMTSQDAQDEMDEPRPPAKGPMMAQRPSTIAGADVPLDDARRMCWEPRRDPARYHALKDTIPSLETTATRLLLPDGTSPRPMKHRILRVAEELSMPLTIRSVPGDFIVWGLTDDHLQPAQEITARLQSARQSPHAVQRGRRRA